MCSTETLGMKLTFEAVSIKYTTASAFFWVDYVKVFLDGKELGTFRRRILSSLLHLLNMRTGKSIWAKLSTETRYLIHAEDRGEYVLLWLNDFTGKKPTRREAVLIKA